MTELNLKEKKYFIFCVCVFVLYKRSGLVARWSQITEVSLYIGPKHREGDHLRAGKSFRYVTIHQVNTAWPSIRGYAQQVGLQEKAGV